MSTSLWPIEREGLVPADDFQRRYGGGGHEPALVPPTEWREWLRLLFARSLGYPFAPHHEAFWEHVWSVVREPDIAPRPWLSIWAREGGKSTNLELASAALGTEGERRYIVYVRRTQAKADDSVQNIGAKLESPGVEAYYPDHARPLVSQHGTRRAWRRNRLRTAGGLTIDAIGLDVAVRGAKIEDDRPDVIILDDIDEEGDSAGVTLKKAQTITTAILPAGAENVFVLGGQNLIIPDGIFSQLVDGRADYLTRRIVSGPHPAVKGLRWEWRENQLTGTREPTITAGEPTWAGQSIEKCERNMALWGPTAFEREAQHEVFERAEGLALNFDAAEHFEDWTPDEVKAAVRLGDVFGGLDFGAWRFFWVLYVVDHLGIIRRVDELFSQREELSVRAQRIHDRCVALGLIVTTSDGMRFASGRRVRLWGDAANPTDITELNSHWRRIGSPLRVVAVAQGLKVRRTAVDRINEALAQRSLRYVRHVGAGDRWFLGYNAGSKGRTAHGSRLLWETNHWSYATPKAGKVDLKQDPDDHTADGADAMAAQRYALMSYWSPAAEPEGEDLDAFAPDVIAAEADRTWRLKRTKPKRPTHHDEDYDG